MAYEQRDMSGSLFKNDRRTSDNHPQAKGRAMVGGVMYWVSAWTKEGRDGQKWQSLAFTPMEEQQTKSAPAAAPPADFDDSLPF